jgi:hypothetical protein
MNFSTFRYTYSGHPVIVTDAMRNWTAQHVFDFRFLKTLYQQLPQAQQSQDCQLIATNSGFANLGEVFNGSYRTNTEPWHIGWYVLLNTCSYDLCVMRRRSLHTASYVILIILFVIINISIVARTVFRRHVTAEAPLHSLVSQCGICGG